MDARVDIFVYVSWRDNFLKALSRKFNFKASSDYFREIAINVFNSQENCSILTPFNKLETI